MDKYNINKQFVVGHLGSCVNVVHTYENQVLLTSTVKEGEYLLLKHFTDGDRLTIYADYYTTATDVVSYIYRDYTFFYGDRVEASRLPELIESLLLYDYADTFFVPGVTFANLHNWNLKGQKIYLVDSHQLDGKLILKQLYMNYENPRILKGLTVLKIVVPNSKVISLTIKESGYEILVQTEKANYVRRLGFNEYIDFVVESVLNIAIPD